MSENYEGIAIIGTAGRFPGAGSVEQFWANLTAGKESVSFFTDAELVESGLDPAHLKSRGQYVPARGVLENAECFDAAFFGVHPKEAEVMDPQQRVFLETCWEALERAGYSPNSAPGIVGVFGGATYNTYYLHALHARPDLTELIGADLVMFGNERDYLTTRVAYKLGLKGPALNVSTACSTSLVAVAQACQSLLTYACDMALAGGVSVTVPQKRGYYYDEGNIGSPDGHTRTFDTQAAGTTFGNGVGVVVLKRLEDAVRDGDQIVAVIKGAALNNDGSQRVSFGAPGVEGQAAVIGMAHALAGVDADTITYVEAHGTATPLGDPIEVAGLTQAFRASTDAKQFCAIGSVKTNVGHLDAAAGVTGLIKTALALHHRTIPASLHFTAPNPKLDLENSPFYVNQTLQSWSAKPGVPRRAGVSSFGSGGTNAHLVLEEAPELPASGPSRPWQLLPLSAKSPDALDRTAANLSAHLKSASSTSTGAAPHLADTAFTLQSGRSEFTHRRIAVCRDAAEGAALFDSKDPKRVFSHHQQLQKPPVVFMFPGQGAQYAGMGAEPYRHEPIFRAEVDRCAELLRPLLNADLRTLLFPAAGAEAEAEQLLLQTRFTQPALFVTEYALAKLWMSWGIRPAAMIGHSVGEIVAGCLAGVFSLEDALTIVARRAALVQEQPGGAMLAVRLPEQELGPLLNGKLTVAAVNSPNLCVVSGPYEAITALEETLGQRRLASRHLQTSHAFHSKMMEPVLEPFATVLRSVQFNDPQIPFVSNVTGRWITPQEARSVEYWVGHVRQTVRFSDGVGELLKDERNVFLEVGPGQTLTTLARQHPAKVASHTILASLPLTGGQEQRGLLETLGRLWMTGVEVDWQGFYADERRHRVTLPTYPFERKRYWPVAATKVETRVAALSAPAVERSRDVPVAVAPVFPAPQPVAVATVPRKDRLTGAVRSLLADLSGYDLSQVESSANLLELGLDSLLLTQASTLMQRRFGVSITFRQLMEELDSIDAIAGYLDAKLPPEAPEPAAPPAPAHTAASALATVPAAVPAGDSSHTAILTSLLQQQQELTNQILRALGQPTVAASTAAVAARPVPTLAPAPTAVDNSASVGTKAHGPFKPIDRSAAILTADQKAALDAFIARYIERTPESKKHAAANRPNLADPRSVAGFKPIWKEMVYPIFTVRSEGSRVWDVDGNEYLDFVMGFGASLFGHRPRFVVDAIKEQAEIGFEIGPIQPIAGEVAVLMKEFTGMERVAFTNTGSEAVLAATRVARTVTGRDKIAVFAGAYHGIFDEVLFRPMTIDGQAAAAPIAPGIPDSAVGQVIVLEYGSPQAIETLRARGSEIAAVLLEPVQSRRLDLQPRDFLHQVRQVTKETGSALIFDEVVTGFRVHPGGAQHHFGVRADIATYGKVIGGGVSIGVVAGDARYLDALDGGKWQYGDASFPEAGVTFFAGTFVRHPLALAAAKAVLLHLKAAGPQLQERLAERTAQLADQLRSVIAEFGAPYQVTQFSSLIQLGFPPEQKYAGLLFYMLRDRGIHIWENRAFVITTAHTEEDFTRLLKAFRESLAEMRSSGFVTGSANVSSHASPASIAPAASAISGAAQQSSLAHANDPFPLTEAQKEIWFASQMGGASAIAYNESVTLDFRGPFDIENFRTAARRVVERHPILLGSIAADGQTQKLRPGATLDLPLSDFSSDSESTRQQELQSLIEGEASTPFDLTAGPLLRVRIVRLSADHHAVVWTAHHIVCDGWSGGLLIGELAKIYSALTQGSEPTLELPIPFRQYALAAQAQSAEAQASLAYWQQQFADVPPPLDLPIDRPRLPLRTGAASTLKRILAPELHHALRRTAQKQRTTLVVLLLASLDALLHRLTGQADMVIGLGAAGQAISGNDCLVGHCLNTLPIRMRLDPDAPFAQNLAAVKKTMLDAMEHHHNTIGEILQHVNVPRNPGRSPLIEVLFNVDQDAGAAQFHGLAFEIHRNAKRGLHFDLFFNFVEGPRGIFIECDYNSDLFDAATVERWLENCQVLLEGIAANPAEELSKLPVLTSGERTELLSVLNQTDSALPELRTLHAWFEAQAMKTPAARAVTFGKASLNYSELDRRANALAHHLIGLGVGPGALVGICLGRSLDVPVALLGILKSGAAYVPLDPHFPQDRLAYMVEDSAMRVLVTHADLAEKLSLKPPVVVKMESIPATAGTPAPSLPAVQPEDLAYVLYTSGSTGKPKGVEIPHLALVNFLHSMQKEPGFASTDTLLAVTTLSFDIAGLELYLPLITGGSVHIASTEDSHDPVRLMQLMRDSRCTVMQATPATWRALIDSGWTGSPALKILCGGEAFPPDLAQQLLTRCTELWNMYGPTETTIWSTVHRLNASATQANTAIPIGHPIANTQVLVLDRHLHPVPLGAVGELYIAGTGLARGYLRRPELTQERFIACATLPSAPRLYRTGDMARWLPDRTLECLGRVDNQVKIRGFRIELGEIESALNAHPSIRQSAAIASAHQPGEKVLVAYYEPQSNPVNPGPAAPAPTVADLRAHLRSSLPDYMIPSIFIALDRLPLTPNGKIDRKFLPVPQEGARPDTSADFTAPRDPVEHMLAGAFSKILKVKRVGLRDNFFDLGGHSLAAVRLLAEVQKSTGKTLPLAILFQASTVESLAEILRRDGWAPSWSSLVPMRAGAPQRSVTPRESSGEGAVETPTGTAADIKEPLFLVHGAEGNVLLYRQLVQHLGSGQPVYGLQSQGLMSEGPLPGTIPEMAAHYIEEVMTVQPRGPYYLAGYCLGGTIALEMAQQLTALGETVGAVVMFETYNEAVVSRIGVTLQAPVHVLQNVWFHSVNLLSIRSGDRGKFLREKLDVARSRAGIRMRALGQTLLRWGGQKPKNDYARIALKRVNDEAAIHYVPRPYHGKVVVIRPKGHFVGLASPSLGWKEVVGNDLEVAELPVYPKGMLIEPFCGLLAQRLERCLDRACGSPTEAPVGVS